MVDGHRPAGPPPTEQTDGRTEAGSGRCCGRGAPFDYIAVKALAQPAELEVPEVAVGPGPPRLRRPDRPWRCSVTTYTPEIGDRISALLAEFKLSSAAEQMTRRFLDADCDQP